MHLFIPNSIRSWHSNNTSQTLHLKNFHLIIIVIIITIIIVVAVVVVIIVLLFVYGVVVSGQTFRYISSQADLRLCQCFFYGYPYAASSAFNYETDHRMCEMTLGGWHCGLRHFKLGCPLHTGFEPMSLAWLACSTGQSATTFTTVAVV